MESSIELLCEFCFYNCRSLASVTFELDSKLQRIDESTFAESGLIAIQVPASVELLCRFYFCDCFALA
jgi:hypothetical protein